MLSIHSDRILEKITPFEKTILFRIANDNIVRHGMWIYTKFSTSDGKEFDFRENAVDHEINLLLK